MVFIFSSTAIIVCVILHLHATEILPEVILKIRIELPELVVGDAEHGAGYCKYIGGAGVGEGVEDPTPRFGLACGADARCENGDKVGNSLCRGVNGCVGGEIQDCGLYACVDTVDAGAPAPFRNTDCSEDSD